MVHLHRVARTHTPTSIESPLPLQSGVLIQGEDAYALIQDYALCPPSQRIQLRLLTPPYTTTMRNIVQEGGYRQLIEGRADEGSSVLLRVDGPQVATSFVRNAVAADGRRRGMTWNFTIEKVTSDEENLGIDVSEKSSKSRLEYFGVSQWVLNFVNENEARRFVRSWHRKVFSTNQDTSIEILNAELLY